MSDIEPEKMESRAEDADCEEISLNEFQGLPFENQIFSNRNVLMEFNKLGSREDLYLLRQLKEEYYEILNSVLLEHLAESIKFPKLGYRRNPHPDPESDEEEEVENEEDDDDDEGMKEENQLDETDNETNFGQELNGIEVNIDEDIDKYEENHDEEIDAEEHGELEDEYYGDEDPVENFCWKVTFIGNEDKVTVVPIFRNSQHHKHNWTPKIAHIFRKLDLHEVWIGSVKKENMKIYEIFTDLAPYITFLRLNALDSSLDSENPGDNYSEFLNKFTNLKSLEIDYNVGHSNYWTFLRMSIEQLEIGLGNLKSNPTIKFCSTLDHEDLMPFATKDNVSFKFHFQFIIPEDFDDFKSFFEEFGHLKNIIYVIEMSHPISNLTQMKIFTAIFVQLANQIEYLDISFDFDFDGSNFEEEDELGVRKCMERLSPLLTNMNIYVRSKPNWNILSGDLEWPKLTNLEIVGYQHALEILKQCPSLEKLYIHSNLDLCLFSNTQQSDKENLNEYFGNLHQLTELRFGIEKEDHKLANGNELDEYLKELLPQLKKINFIKLLSSS